MKKWVVISSIILIGIITYAIYMYYYSINSKTKNEAEALELAKAKANITEVYSTNYYHGICLVGAKDCPEKETKGYTVVTGIDNENTELIVFIPENGDNPIVTKKEEGITQDKALSLVREKDNMAELKSVRLGIDGYNRPIWEVVYIDTSDRLTYRHIIFETGEFSSRFALPK